MFFLLLLLPLAMPRTAAGKVQVLKLPENADYEIYSVADDKAGRKGRVFLNETPRNALNEDGLCGYFVSETADRLKPKRMFFGGHLEFYELSSRRGYAYKADDKGSVNTLAFKLNYIGEWAEWAVTLPIHRWELTAPRTYNTLSTSNQGIGNAKLGWKATYLPDRSYYRFAYGAVAYVTTGNPDTMLPANAKKEDELKIFGCVTTQETDNAVGNLELGTILNSESRDNRFIYRLAMSYEASIHATLIGELAGEVQGGDDRDSLDLIGGVRLSPTPFSVLELAIAKNLRTYREYGWDARIQVGYTIRW